MKDGGFTTGADEKYCMIGKAVHLKHFSLPARVLAALHLAEQVTALTKRADGKRYSLMPEAVLVHIENGDVRILPEKCPEEGAGDADLFRFAAYMAFRLLCVDDPLDGRETLVKYPYLSKEAAADVWQGKYGFILSDGPNRFSDYIGKTAAARWNALPAFLQRAFQEAFDTKEEGGEKEADLAYWLVQMRKLRDCLVLEDRRWSFWEPEASGQTMVLEMKEYQVHVQARKAIYWYHVEAEFDAQTNGIVGGIGQDGFLENRSRFVWSVEAGEKKLPLYPAEKIKLETGMVLKIEDTDIYVAVREAAK